MHWRYQVFIFFNPNYFMLQKEVVERLNTELNKALNLPEVRDRLGALALETEPMNSSQFGGVIAAETEKWQRIGRAAQIKAD